MTEPPDLEALARRYLDLWQDHLGTMARDPAVSEVLARSFSLMTQGLAEAARDTASSGATRDPADPTAPAGEHHDRSDAPGETGGGETGGGETRKDAASAAGASPVGLASGEPGPARDELAARVERLEQRVALLEAALGGRLARAGGGA